LVAQELVACAGAFGVSDRDVDRSGVRDQRNRNFRYVGTQSAQRLGCCVDRALHVGMNIRVLV
jgi:hypothetical protein